MVAAVPSPAAHQAEADGVDVPPWGEPADKKSTMPTTMAAAPSQTRRSDQLIGEPAAERQGDDQAHARSATGPR